VAKTKTPEIISLSALELEQLLSELRGPLAPGTYQLVEALLRTLQWVMALLEKKTVSLARLRRLLFGPKTETTQQLLPKGSVGDASSTNEAASTPKAKRKGHGRKAATEYPGAQRVKVPHPTLCAGQLCPKCSKGKLFLLSLPARLICLVAQPTSATSVNWNGCGALCAGAVTAPAP
jgi:hypothetical protein